MPIPRKGKTGLHEPTDITRSEVTALKSFGNTHAQIATYLKISEDTLERKYRDELDNAIIQANAKVANCLFRKATEQDDLGAMIFWLKTRGKWRTADSEETKKFETVVEKLLLKGLDS